MANLSPVIPSVIGQPQTARKQVHMVDMPNPLAGLGNSLGNLGEGLGKLGLGIALIEQERSHADYVRLLNEAESKVIQRMNDEVYSQDGFSAEGSLERTGRIFKETMDEFSERKSQLTKRDQQRFEENWGRFYNNHQNQSMRHEYGQVKGAQLGANDKLIDTGIEAYVESGGDPEMMFQASLAFDENWRLRNGGHLTNPAAVEAFKRDIEDEDGKVSIRGGKKLDIVEDAEPGTPGVITKAQVQSVLKNMEKEAAAYEAARMSMWDKAHAKMIDTYLDQDRVNDADTYLKSVEERGLITAAAKKAANEAIDRKRDVLEISTETTKLLDELQAKAGGESIAYGSELQDRLYTETMREIDRTYTGEKYKKGQQIKSQLAEKYRLLKDAQKARAASDVVNKMKQMQDAGLSLPEMYNSIQSMNDSVVKTALQKAYDRQKDAYDENTDPGFLLTQEERLNALKLNLAKGEADLDGIHYNFNEQKQIIAYARNLGFTKANEKRAAAYINASSKQIDAVQAGTELAKQIGVDTPAEALNEYPWILRDLETIKGTSVIEPDKMGAWLKSNISAILSQEATKDRPIIWDTTKTIGDFAAQGVDPGTLYQDEEQLLSAYRSLLAQQAIQRNDLEGAKKAFEAKPSQQELMDFARNNRGMTYKKGNYYFTGGK